MTNLEQLKAKANPKVFDLFVKLAGDKVDALAARAINLALAYEKKVERAMADVLEKPAKNKVELQ